MFLSLVIFVFLLNCVYQEKLAFLRDLTKACLLSMETRDSNIIVFVIIHDTEFRDGVFFRLNLILKKHVVLGLYPLKISVKVETNRCYCQMLRVLGELNFSTQ